MKKFLGILVIAGALVACNNSGESTTGADTLATDSSALNSIPPAVTDSSSVDTLHTGVDTTKAGADTTKK
jgi:hypothetical protein